MLGKKLVIIAVAAIVAFSLSGCTKRYVFDFKQAQTTTSSEGNWTEHDDPILFGEEGAYLDATAITCPFRFSGDFAMEVYFYLNIADTHLMDWLEMYLIDTNEWEFHSWFGMGMQQVSADVSYHWAAQHGSSPSITGILPGLVVDGNNKAEFIKEGDFVVIKLNGQQVGAFALTPENQIPYYRPFLSAYDDGTEQWKGVYFQKVVVKYEDGNIAP